LTGHQLTLADAAGRRLQTVCRRSRLHHERQLLPTAAVPYDRGQPPLETRALAV